MQIQEEEVTLRKLIASEGKVIVSKTKNEEGNYVVKAKEVYLAKGQDINDFEEINEVAADD